MKKRIISLLIVSGLLLASCDWQMPETVTVKGSPEVYVPSGATVFELDFLDDIATDFSEAMAAGEPATTGSSFTAGEDVSVPDGDSFTLFAALTVGELGELPSSPFGAVDVVYSDVTAELNLSDTFGPIPSTVELVNDSENPGELPDVPGRAWVTPTTGAVDDPVVYMRLQAQWSLPESGSLYLLGQAGSADNSANYQQLSLSELLSADYAFEMAEVLNARPEDLTLSYDFLTTTDDATDVDSITIRFEIPFVLETVGEAFLDIEDDQGNNELAMDDDIFDRDPQDPDEDLDDFLDALRGSSAELVMKLENTAGFGATLAMVNGAADWGASEGATLEQQEAAKQDPANWIVDLGIEPAETLQQVQLDISAATLDEIIDGVPVNGVSQFTPEFLIELPWNGVAGTPQPVNQFSIKKGAAFNVAEGYMRVQADFDYTYSLEDEE